MIIPLTLYIYINNMQEYTENQRSTVWEDLFYNYSIKDITVAEQLVTILDEARIDSFRLQAAFQEEYQRTQFQNQLRLQQEGEHPDMQVVKKFGRRFLKRPEGYERETTMNLTNNVIKNKIFMQVYDEEITRMQHQNDYRIFCDRSQLRIFMRENCQLNMLCKNKLDEMRNQLSVYIQRDIQTLIMFKTSQKLTQQLAKQDIKVQMRYIQGVIQGYFYSTTHRINQIQSMVNQIARLHITILNFRCKTLSIIQNQSLFSLIAELTLQTAKRLEQNYEVEIEYNKKCQCIVIHKKHACFGIQVEQQLKQILNEILLVSFKSETVRKFSNKVRKQIKQLPFLKQKMKGSRNESFLAINKQKFFSNGEINVKNSQQLSKLLKIVVQRNLNIKVFVHHLNQSVRVSQRQRIVELAQEMCLIEIQEHSSKTASKNVFKLKDWSQTVMIKRQRNVIQFIQKLLLNQIENKKQLNSLVQSFMEDFQEKESENYSRESKLVRSEISVLKQKNYDQLKWYQYQFQMPPIKKIQQQDRAYILDKRKRELQKIFLEKGHVKCAISSVYLSSNVNWPKEVYQQGILIRNAFKNGKINDKWQQCTLNEVKLLEEVHLAHLSKQLNLEFVPWLVIKRIE